MRDPRMPNTAHGASAVVGTAFLAGLAVLVAAGPWFVLFGSEGAGLIAASVAPLILLGGIVLMGRPIDLMEPLMFVWGAALLGTVARTWYVVASESPNAVDFVLLGERPAVLFTGLYLVSVGLTAFVFGYLAPTARIPIERLFLGRRVNRRRLAVLLAVLGLVGLLAIALYVQKLGLVGAVLSGRISAKSRYIVSGATYEYAALGYYRWGASLLSLVFIVAWALFAATKKPIWSATGLLVLLLGLAASIFPIITSSRTGVLLQFVYAAIAWHYLRRPFTVRMVSALLAVVLGLLVTLGALRSFSHGQVEGVGDALGTEAVVEGVLGNRHFLAVDVATHMARAVPEDLSYATGWTLVTWAYAPVPRTFWPDKPIVRVGQYLGESVFGRDGNVTGVPPGFIGELYWNFSWFGVVVGMAVLGSFLRVLYQTARPMLSRNAFVALLYGVIAYSFSVQLLDSDLTGAVTTFLRMTIPLIMILALASQRVEGPQVS